MKTVRDQLVADNEFYKRMLQLVPQQLLSAQNDDDDNNDDDDESGVSCEESMELEGDDGEVNSSDDQSQQKKRPCNRVTLVPHNVDDNDNDDDLATKLHKKLEALRAKRCKSGSTDRLERNRLKRRLSKAKLKQRRIQEKQQGKVNGSQGQGSASKSKERTGSKSPLTNKPIFNKEGKVVFSKFDFSDKNGGTVEKKRKSDVPTGRNYKQLLEKVHKQTEMIANVERVDKVKAAEMKEKVLWKKVLSKAEGVKVRDDPDLLKRALKKKEGRVKKSKKEWKNREDQVDKRIKGQQDKRKQNILKRKTAKHEKIKKKNSKKGRLIPGF